MTRFFEQWKTAASNDYNEFIGHSQQIETVQEELLIGLLQKNQTSQFGQEHHFEELKNYEDFCRNIPVRTYDQLQNWLQKCWNGQKQVLCAEDVLLFEPTSGTSQQNKLIPYTLSLKQEFQKAINCWLFDIMLHFPKIADGLQYWSISPMVGKNDVTAGGTKIGFESDFEYLDMSESDADSLFAVPSQIKNVNHIEQFRYITAYFLLCARNLSFISIWHPSFITLLIQTIEDNWEELIHDISDGKLSVEKKYQILFQQKLKPNPERANELQLLVEKRASFNEIWPNLQLISCWHDKHGYFEKIQTLFPQSVIQPKGLLATEGITSIPLLNDEGHVPAYTSHFLEFRDSSGTCFPIHQIETGKSYEVILTTGGGLYRYSTRDMVQVCGYFNQLPLLSFVGRMNTFDLVGEKLDEHFIQQTIGQLFINYHSKPLFWFFAPQRETQKLFYCLFIETDKPLPEHAASELDVYFRENFHYDYARTLNQLFPIRIYEIKNGLQSYIQHQTSKGMSLGNIKIHPLSKEMGWEVVFEKLITSK